MKKWFGIAAVALAIVMIFSWPGVAQLVGDQIWLSMRFVNTGPSQYSLQTGKLSTLSAAVAGATLTEVVAAPASGSVYLRAVLVEKSTGASGSFTVRQGNGTNCDTGTTVIFGPQVNPQVGTHPLGLPATAGKAVCLETDAATTSVRALYN